MKIHEKLYSLYTQREETEEELWQATQNPPLFFFRKYDREATQLAKKAQEDIQNFSFMLHDVLSNHHGINKSDISGTVDVERLFKLLINRRMHEVFIKPVGSRLVVFVDGIALNENEKVSSLRMKMRLLVG